MTLDTAPPADSVVICLDEMGPESARSFPGQRLVRSDPSGQRRTRFRFGRSLHEVVLDRVCGYHATEPYAKTIRKRQVWVEPLFAEAKDWHGLRRFRLRGLPKVNGEALMIAAGQNLKRLLSHRDWGRRPFPTGTRFKTLPRLSHQ